MWAIKQNAIQHVGRTRQKPLTFCLIAASNMNLMECVRNNNFCMDLYFHLKVATLEFPLLHDQPKDISTLTKRFCQECNEAEAVFFQRPEAAKNGSNDGQALSDPVADL